MRVDLRNVALPDFGSSGAPPSLPVAEFEARAATLYDRAHADWVVVYGDREHSQNLAFLTGHDPRFEEALLILGPGHRRYLLVGNEGRLHARAASLPVETLLCQSLSLMGQPRKSAPRLSDVLRETGISKPSSVAVVGWKYLESVETDDVRVPAFVPAIVLQALATLGCSVVDATRVMMDPSTGLRVRNTAAQIAAFEWAASRASVSVMRIIRAAEPGKSELETVSAMQYAGDPLSCHVMFASGKDAINGLRSPTSRRLEVGDGAVTAVGFWGGLSCRGGLISDARQGAFMEKVVKPYFGAIVAWYESMKLDATGKSVYSAVVTALAGAPFRPFVNPGHQIGHEEWINTPIREESSDRIASGMLFQSDIIPFPMPDGTVVNCEDTVAIADRELREELEREFRDVWDRVVLRRDFIRAQLGIQLREEVLPLSSSPAYLTPFWREPALACVVG